MVFWLEALQQALRFTASEASTSSKAACEKQVNAQEDQMDKDLHVPNFIFHIPKSGLGS